MLYIIGIHVYMELTGVYMCNKLQTLIDAGNCYDVQYVYWNTRHVNKINSVYALYQGQRFHIFIERLSKSMHGSIGSKILSVYISEKTNTTIVKCIFVLCS